MALDAEGELRIGLLGMSFLRHFKVILDLEKGEARFEGRGPAPSPTAEDLATPGPPTAEMTRSVRTRGTPLCFPGAPASRVGCPRRSSAQSAKQRQASILLSSSTRPRAGRASSAWSEPAPPGETAEAWFAVLRFGPGPGHAAEAVIGAECCIRQWWPGCLATGKSRAGALRAA